MKMKSFRFLMAVGLFCLFCGLSLPLTFADSQACNSIIQNEGYDSSLLSRIIPAQLPNGFCATAWVVNATGTRTLLYLPTSKSVLAVSSGQIMIYRDINNNGFIDEGPCNSLTSYAAHSEYCRLIIKSDLTHGLAVYQSFLFASSDSTVYVWDFNEASIVSGQIQLPLIANPRVLIYNIPSGGLYTRTLLIDPRANPSGQFNYLYLSVGAFNDANTVPDRALVRRYNLNDAGSGFYNSLNYDSGTIIGSGLRNSVGLAFDKVNRIWGADGAPSGLYRPDLGPLIDPNNPADEINLIDTTGTTSFYGFPFCFSQYLLNNNYTGGTKAGTQYVWGSYEFNTSYSDSWCRNNTNNRRPIFATGAHTSPLSLLFYNNNYNNNQNNNTGPDVTSRFLFPSSYWNNLFITQHGSLDRVPPVGYKIVTINVTEAIFNHPEAYIQGEAQGDLSVTSDFFKSPGMYDVDNQWPFRPVDIKQGGLGEVYFSSDTLPPTYSSSSTIPPHIIVIRYNNGLINPDRNKTAPTDRPALPVSNANSILYHNQAGAGFVIRIMGIIMALLAVMGLYSGDVYILV